MREAESRVEMSEEEFKQAVIRGERKGVKERERQGLGM